MRTTGNPVIQPAPKGEGDGSYRICKVRSRRVKCSDSSLHAPRPPVGAPGACMTPSMEAWADVSFRISPCVSLGRTAGVASDMVPTLTPWRPVRFKQNRPWRSVLILSA